MKLFRKNTLSSTDAVDIIENIVYDYLKPLGFRKHGRTLHRFVDGDISQVVNLQNGCPQKGVYDILWINLGIRVPECQERCFNTEKPLKKYYHEYECNIRTRLGKYVDGTDTFYDLKKNPEKIGADIVGRLKEYVVPVFDTLISREAILKHRAEYPRFDEFGNRMIILEEAMIMGRMGDIAEATRLFNEHYQNAIREYNQTLEHGTEIFLRKGQRIVIRNKKTDKNETITAEKDGFVTIFSANKGHLLYLEGLARETGIELHTP